MRSCKVTVPKILKMKRKGTKITMLTAYDATFARILDQAEIDILLVGDSLGMVIQGHANTLPVTLEDMIYHCRAVTNVVQRSHVVGDMPFMSYQTDATDALRNAGRLVKEGGVEAIKLEGGTEVVDCVRTIVKAGIPVMAHIGLTPQSIHQFGGYKIQGRDNGRAKELIEGAQRLQDAGAYSIVLEGIPQGLAQQITEKLTIPTIGIGAGLECDGQVLVIYDLLGMDPEFRPRFVKRYDNLHERITGAVKSYIQDVRQKHFPSEEHSFS